MYDNFINWTGAGIFIGMVAAMLVEPVKWFYELLTEEDV